MRARGLFLGLALAAVVAGSAAPARADTAPAPQITWVAPSPAEGATFEVQTGSQLSIAVAAADTTPDAIVHVATSSALPAGATLGGVDANPGTATLAWTPTATQVGGYVVTFTATDNGVVPTTASLSITINVTAAPPPPPLTQLTDDKIARWAFVLQRVVARTQPSLTAPVITVLQTTTVDHTQNLVLALEQRTDATGGVWVRARLPILPNNSTGWIQRGALGAYHLVHTHLYVDRGLQTAVLLRDGQPIWRARVGVGKPYWPTPTGEFYIRDMLIDFPDTFYGPLAFGTSARSAVLTDWPNGGFVGVHGTSLPQLIPGQISHGCVRVRNPDILRLAKLMPVGSPLTVT